MSVAARYSYRVTWSPKDDEYVATVAELPSLSWLESDFLAAMAGIRRLATDTVADLEASHESVPQPLSDRSYSGTFNLRIPPELHRRLSVRAAEEHVSLNHLISSRLASID